MPPHTLQRTLGWSLALVVGALVRPPLAYAPDPPLQALALFEVVLEGLRGPHYLTVDLQDRLLLSEGEPGRVLQIAPDRTVTVLLDQVVDPEGLAVDPAGALFIAAERQQGAEGKGQNGVILRRDPQSPTPSIIANRFKQPKGLALDGAGRPVVSAEGQQGDADPKGSLYAVEASGAIPLLAEAFTQPQGVLPAPAGSVLVAAERFERDHAVLEGSVFQVDPAGRVTALLLRRLKNPFGVARDPLNGLYVSGTLLAGPAAEVGVILKRRPDGPEVVFAQGLREPRGLAFDSHGHLYVVEAQKTRLLKFAAPAAPRLDPAPPAVTNQATLLLHGLAEPGALLTVQGGSAPVIGFADAGGHFALAVALAGNAATTLQLFATAAAGDGLTSPPTHVTVVHDAIPPSLRLVNPPDGATATGAFAVEVEATDVLAGVERVNLLVDGRVLAVTNVVPYRFTLDARDFTGGRHTLTVQATDRAGNQASTSITIMVATLRIAITSPADGATLATPVALVQGTIEASAPEVGLVVNGVQAQAQGSKFAALVRLIAGPNQITATGTDTFGSTATSTVTVTLPPDRARPPEFLLAASPTNGVAPLSVRFSLLGLPVIGNLGLDLDGDGTVDITPSTLEGQTFTYTQPGLYVPTVRIADAIGNQFTTSTLLQVYDRTALDTLLQGKWTTMKEALRRGDIDKALSAIALTKQQRYREMLTALAPQLSQVDRILTDISLVSVDESRAEYQMLRIDGGVRISHFVLFVVDGDGIWRLMFF